MKIEDVLAPLHEIGREVQRLTGDGRLELQVSPPRAHMLSKYARCPGMFHGIIVLLEAKHPNQAMVLGRPLFEESCHLRQLEQTREDADALILTWYEDSLRRQGELLHDAASVGLESDLDPALALVQKDQEKLDGYRARHNVRRRPRFDIKNRALADGREEAWWAYKLSHQFVHGNESQHRYMRRRTEEGVMEIRTTSDDLSWIAMVGAFGADSFLHAYRAAAGLFGWATPAILDELEQETEDLVVRTSALPEGGAE